MLQWRRVRAKKPETFLEQSSQIVIENGRRRSQRRTCASKFYNLSSNSTVKILLQISGLDVMDSSIRAVSIAHRIRQERRGKTGKQFALYSFNLSAEDLKRYEVVKSKFENHFIAKRNVIYERAKFNLRVQNKSEPVECFITDLHCLAEHCQFGTLKDQLIRDRIVVGLKNKRLSEKLQLDPDLTLEKAMNQAKQSEEVKKQQKVIHPKLPGASGSNIDAITKINISSSFTVQNVRTRLVKIDHVCFGYLATTIHLSVLLSITHKKVHCKTSEHQNNVFTSE